jgi:CrcB protein
MSWNVAWVALGGALGSGLRYGASRAIPRLAGFPLATLLVNVTGCLAFGLAAGWLASRGESARLFVLTGVLGGFTTFSTFGAETGTLLRESPGGAALYVALSVGAGIAAFLLGAWLSGAGPATDPAS